MRAELNGRPRRSSWRLRLVLGAFYAACVIFAWALVLTVGCAIADLLNQGTP